jgi:hypothetical protein
MSRIQCFMIRETGRQVEVQLPPERFGGKAWYTVYADDQGREFVVDSADGAGGIPPAPVGAMWDSPRWHDCEAFHKGDDGMVLTVRTPGGDWTIDAPSSKGGYWSRSGVAPRITASPSILIQTDKTYHGWLRDGWLEEC